MRRLYWVPLVFVLVLVMGAIGTVAGIAASTNGSRWLVDQAVAASGASIELSGLDGTLLQGMRAARLRILAGTTIVEIDGLEIAPAWSASVLRGAVVIDRLAASSLRIISPVTNEPSPISFAFPKLPFALDIRELKIAASIISNVPGEYAPAASGRVSYDAAGYALSSLQLSAPAYSVSGDVVIETNADVALHGELVWQLAAPSLRGRLELRDSLRSLGVTLSVDEPAVETRGTVRVLGEVKPRFDLQTTLAEWSSEHIHVAGLSIQLSGTLERFDVHAAASISVPDLPQAQVALEAAGSLDALDVARLSLVSERGGVVANGRITRTPEWSADLRADVNNFDPALLAETLSGAVSGRVELTLKGDDLDVNVTSLSGVLNDAPFEAKGHVGRRDDRWSARGVEVRSGPNQAVVELDWQGDDVSGRARLNMPNLGTLLPELHGDVSGSVAVSGRRDAPDIELSVSSKSLRYQEWSASGARLEATVKEGASGNARIDVAQASRDGVRLTRVDGTVRGTLDALTGSFGWNLSGDLLEKRGSVELSARKNGDRWNVKVQSGALLTLPGERWRLDRDVDLNIAETVLGVSPHCWLPTSAQGRVCLDAAVVEGEHIRLAGAIEAFDIAGIASRFESAPHVAGRIAGRWDVAGDNGHWKGSARLNTEALRLLDEQDPAAIGIELPTLSAAVELKDNRAEVTLHADTETARVLAADLTVNGFDESAALDGRVVVALKDLGFLSTFTRRLGETAGALDGEFSIAGSVAAPDVHGVLNVRNARIVITEPRVELSAMELTMRLSGTEQWTVDGRAQSDKGRVTLTGALRAPLRDSRTFHARVEATDLPISIPDATARVAGGVDIDWRSQLISVRGRVEIPRAEIKLSELPPGAVAVSEDVVVINREEVRPGGTRLEVDLEVVLKDQVHFTAFGLDTGLTGALRLRQSAEGVVQLNGTLTLIDGSFSVYGQKLAIESGRLTYSGPPQDPYVDASASRTIREPTRTVTVGARIQGPARAIETTLFSTPAMSEAETLAYLVLGRPLNSATAQEGNNVMGAAIALGLEGASPVIKEVSSALHIDELTATGGSTEDLTVVAGKRFSDRVFVRYSYQTFTRTSAILFELLINRRLSLEATASDIPAIDVLYRVGENN
jgi:translocation and assembly module TamB